MQDIFNKLSVDKYIEVRGTSKEKCPAQSNQWFPSALNFTLLLNLR
jgi:hypothetical protein